MQTTATDEITMPTPEFDSRSINDRKKIIGCIVAAIKAEFGDRALAIVQAQIDASEGDIRATWQFARDELTGQGHLEKP